MSGHPKCERCLTNDRDQYIAESSGVWLCCNCVRDLWVAAQAALPPPPSPVPWMEVEMATAQNDRYGFIFPLYLRAQVRDWTMAPLLSVPFAQRLLVARDAVMGYGLYQPVLMRRPIGSTYLPPAWSPPR